MSENDNIEDLFDFDAEPLPEWTGEVEHVWARLNTSLDELDVEQVWTRIDTSLNQDEVDAVWGRLSTTLDKEAKVLWWPAVYRIAAVLAVLFGGYLAFSYLSLDATDKGQKELVVKDQQPGNQTDNESGAKLAGTNPEAHATEGGRDAGEAKTVNSERVALERLAGVPLQDNRIASTNNSGTLEEIEYFERKQPKKRNRIRAKRMERAVSKQVYLSIVEVSEPSHMETLLAFVEGSKDEERKRIYLGANTGFKNQWLLAPETYSGFQKGGLDYTKVDYSNVTSVSVGCKLTEQVSAEVSWLLISQGGQKYVDYIKGQSQVRELDFKYHTFNLVGRWNRKPASARKLPFGASFVLGFYGSFLRSAEGTVDTDQVHNLEGQYRNYDLGTVSGYDLNYYMNERLSFSPGIRYQQGLVNIYKGSEAIPDDFNRTYNAGFELRIGMRYNLGTN